MGLRREVFKHTAIYSFATVLGRLISLIMLPFYAHIFRAEGYGIIALIDASLGVLAIVFASGFHVAILRIYHEEPAERKGQVVSTAIRLMFAGGLAAILLPAIFAPQISRLLLGSDQYTGLFLLSLVTFLIDVGGQSASTSLIIRQQSTLYSAVNLIRLAVGLALNIWLVVILDVGLIGVFITALITTAIASALFLYAAIRANGFAYDRQIARKLLQFQLPLLPGDVISYVSRQAERYLVRFIIDIRAVGILEMAYKFPPLLNLFISIPFTLAWRTKSIEIAEQDHRAPRILGGMFTNYFFLMTFVGLLLAVSIKDLLEILTPPEFWEAAWIARIEIVTTIIGGANTFFVFGLVYRKRTGTISAIRALMAVLKIPLAFLMIITFQLAGAAYSALVVEGLTAVALLSRSQRHYRIEFEYMKLALIAMYGLLIYVLVADYGVGYVVDLSSIKQLTGGLVTDAIRLAPLSESEAQRWLQVVLDRQDSMIALAANIVGSLAFLLAAPLLGLRESSEQGAETA